MRRLASIILLATAASGTLAQDYARESRWQAEVLGNLVVGEPVQVALPARRSFLGLYTPATKGRAAVLLVHGIGVHPDHGVIGSLRMALADMGFTTLSIQMPVLAADAPAKDYLPLFPEAAARIAAAAEWLASREHQRIVLVSHSLGSWMSQYYLEQAKDAPFGAWICMGRGGALSPMPLPVLDVYGEKDNPAVLQSAGSRHASRQVRIAGADHFYTGKEEELARVLGEFLSGLSR